MIMMSTSAATDLCFSGFYFNGTGCVPCAGNPGNSRWASNGPRCGWLCDVGYRESNGDCVPCSGECRSYDVELLQLSELSEGDASLELMFDFCSVVCQKFGLFFTGIFSPSNRMCMCAFKENPPVIISSMTACEILQSGELDVPIKMLEFQFQKFSSHSKPFLAKSSSDSAIFCYQASQTTSDMRVLCLVYGNVTSAVTLMRDGRLSSNAVQYMHVRSTFTPLLLHGDGGEDNTCKSCKVGRFLNFRPFPTAKSSSNTLNGPTRVSSFQIEIAQERSKKMFACARLVKSLGFPYFCLKAEIDDACYAISFADVLKEGNMECWSVQMACEDCSAPAGWYASALSLNFTSPGLPLLNQSCNVECPTDSYTIRGFEYISYWDRREVIVCYEKHAWNLLRTAYVLPVPLGMIIIAVAIHFERKMKKSQSQCAECSSEWKDNSCPIDGLPLSQKLTLEDLGIEMEESFEDNQNIVNLSCQCSREEVTSILVCGHGSCKYESCTNCGCCWDKQKWKRSSLWWIPLAFLTFACFVSWNIGAAFYVENWLNWTKFWWILFASSHAIMFVVYLRTCAYKTKCLRDDCCPCYSPVPMKKVPEGFQCVLMFFFTTFILQLFLTLLTLKVDWQFAEHYGGCESIDCLMYSRVDYRAFCPLCSEDEILYAKVPSNLNSSFMVLGFFFMIVSLICCLRTLHFSIVIGIRICCVCANSRIHEFSYISGCYQDFTFETLGRELFRWPRSCSRCKQRLWRKEKLLDSFLYRRRTNVVVALMKRLSFFVTFRRFLENTRHFYTYKPLGSAQNDRSDIEMAVTTSQRRRKPSAPVVKGWRDLPFLTFLKSEGAGCAELLYDGSPQPRLFAFSKLPKGFVLEEVTGDLKWDLPAEEKEDHYQFDLIASNFVGECRHEVHLFFSAGPCPPASLSYSCSRCLRCRCGGILTRYAGWGVKVVCDYCDAVGEAHRLDWFVCRASGCSFDVCPRCAGKNSSSPDRGEVVFQLYHNVEMFAWCPLPSFFPGFPSPIFDAADLPPGLVIDVATGKISGMPSACGVWMVTVTASNLGGGCQTVFLIEVVSFEPPHDLSYTSVSSAFTGNQFSYDESKFLAIEAFRSPASSETCLIPSWSGTITRFSIHPALPPGVHLEEETGVISGVAKSAMQTNCFTVVGRGPGGMYCCANVRLKIARILEPKIQYLSEGMRKIPLGSHVKIEPVKSQTSISCRHIDLSLVPRMWTQEEQEPEPEKFEPHLVCIKTDVRPPLPEGLSVDEDAVICGTARRPTPATTYSIVVRNEKGLSSSEVSFEILRADGKSATKPRSKLLAFFTTPQGYESVNVHGEAQEMMRKHMDPEFAFDCDVNPQPTFSDFKKFLTSHHGFNVRVLHFAGHGEQNFGFIWNEDHPSIATPAVYDMGELCSLVGRVAVGQTLTGTVECVVLNACQTEMLGKRMRSAGVRNVVCWRTKVKDTTAMEFTDAFYDYFMGKEQIEEEDYQHAFRQAKERIHPTKKSDNSGALSRAIRRRCDSRSSLDVVVFLSKRGDVLPEQRE